MLKTFKGGVHPHDFKELAKDSALVDAPVPEILLVPMAQHLGKPATVEVKVGDEVKRGQLIGSASGFISANIHAPVSGKIKKIMTCETPVGLTCQAVQIENDGCETWAPGCNQEADTSLLTSQDIRECVQSSGVVGMGGATFPTNVKLSPPAEKKIDAVILNGVECEPYLTADYRLMLENPVKVIEGLKLIMKAVNCARGYIGIEANKPDAFAIMQQTVRELDSQEIEISVELLAVKYPQGAEKQLIKAILGREVPSGGLPMAVGVVVQNVGTANAIYEACAFNRPLTERIVTVSGAGVDKPMNLRARIGTPARSLLELCGYQEKTAKKLIYGGPMMGMAHYNFDLPVNKGMSGILVLTEIRQDVFRNCIRCGRCLDGCPQHLMPAKLSTLIESGFFQNAKDEANLLDCIECGVCTYVCPARRPIVQWVKLAKYELNRERMREAAKKKDE